MKIAVVADKRRSDMGQQLATKVCADHLSVDDGTLGCSGNHLAAWRWHAGTTSDWSIVLEDDAVPVEGFREQLALALDAAPAPIVSLYLGTGYISDHRTRVLLQKADALGAHWLVTKGRVFHAVALAIRSELLPSMLNTVSDLRPIDDELSRWARGRDHSVAYSNGSLVDHCDSKSLVCRHARPERRAWRVGGNSFWNDVALPWR